jgi:hypothetical protein
MARGPGWKMPSLHEKSLLLHSTKDLIILSPQTTINIHVHFQSSCLCFVILTLSAQDILCIVLEKSLSRFLHLTLFLDSPQRIKTLSTPIQSFKVCRNRRKKVVGQSIWEQVDFPLFLPFNHPILLFFHPRTVSILSRYIKPFEPLRRWHELISWKQRKEWSRISFLGVSQTADKPHPKLGISYNTVLQEIRGIWHFSCFLENNWIQYWFGTTNVR